MRSRNIYIKIVGGSILIILCCLLTYLLADSTYLPNQPCRPILYANGAELRKTFEPDYYSTDDSLDRIASFYDKELDPVLESESYKLQNDHGVWKVQQMANDGYIYKCRGEDSLGVNVKGCIYVYRQDELSIIETIMYQSSEEVMPCRDTLLP